jgi:hypothetical protein
MDTSKVGALYKLLLAMGGGLRPTKRRPAPSLH